MLILLNPYLLKVIFDIHNMANEARGFFLKINGV